MTYLESLREELRNHLRLPFCMQDSRLIRQLEQRIEWNQEEGDQ